MVCCRPLWNPLVPFLYYCAPHRKSKTEQHATMKYVKHNNAICFLYMILNFECLTCNGYHDFRFLSCGLSLFLLSIRIKLGFFRRVILPLTKLINRKGDRWRFDSAAEGIHRRSKSSAPGSLHTILCGIKIKQQEKSAPGNLRIGFLFFCSLCAEGPASLFWFRVLLKLGKGKAFFLTPGNALKTFNLPPKETSQQTPPHPNKPPFYFQHLWTYSSKLAKFPNSRIPNFECMFFSRCSAQRAWPFAVYRKCESYLALSAVSCSISLILALGFLHFLGSA